MKKAKKLALLIGILMLLFCGCSVNAAADEPAPRLHVVTQVDIICRRADDILQWHYTQPQKMISVLNYVRLLEYRGKVDTDPEKIIGDSYKITVQLSDGRSHVYYQHAERYLSRDHHPWELIDPEQAQRLYPMLQEMPSDLADTA